MGMARCVRCKLHVNVCHVGLFMPGIEQLAALCVSNLAAAHTIQGFPESRCACLLIAVFVVPYRIVPMPSKSQNMCGGGVAPPPHPITGRWAKNQRIYSTLQSLRLSRQLSGTNAITECP